MGYSSSPSQYKWRKEFHLEKINSVKFFGQSFQVQRSSKRRWRKRRNKHPTFRSQVWTFARRCILHFHCFHFIFQTTNIPKSKLKHAPTHTRQVFQEVFLPVWLHKKISVIPLLQVRPTEQFWLSWKQTWAWCSTSQDVALKGKLSKFHVCKVPQVNNVLSLTLHVVLTYSLTRSVYFSTFQHLFAMLMYNLRHLCKHTTLANWCHFTPLFMFSIPVGQNFT